MNTKRIDLADLSGIVDIYQKINVFYDDGTFGYTGTIEDCPMSLAFRQVILLEAADDTLKIILTKG